MKLEFTWNNVTTELRWFEQYLNFYENGMTFLNFQNCSDECKNEIYDRFLKLSVECEMLGD